MGVLAIIFPPLVVAIETGCGIDLCINLLFTLLGWIPGILHAWYILCRGPPTTVILTEREAVVVGPGDHVVVNPGDRVVVNPGDRVVVREGERVIVTSP